ncbi:MAG: cell division topological specificity factor MinE [Clostridia bacterium]|jgi:cell division topological specificity factor|nr:cell division topological specificity factor MinE [Clostridia bacterium]
MFEGLTTFFKRVLKQGPTADESSKDTAKERLHLVLMQDRANVSADFLDLMKQEIIDVIKKYIEVDEKEIDVRLTNKANEDGTTGAPALYANIPIVNIKNELKAEKILEQEEMENQEEKETEQENSEESKDVAEDESEESEENEKIEDNGESEDDEQEEEQDDDEEDDDK